MSTRERRQKATREAILQTARQMITAEGPDAFSVRELARRVDYSPAGLYEYFDGKDDIIAAVCAESIERFSSYLSRVSHNLNPSERLLELGLAYIEFARQNREHFLLIFTSLRTDRQSLAKGVGETSTYRLLLDTVAEGIESGDFVTREGYELEQITYGCWALVHGMAMLQQTHLHGFEADFQRVDRETLLTFSAGLKKT